MVETIVIIYKLQDKPIKMINTSIFEETWAKR